MALFRFTSLAYLASLRFDIFLTDIGQKDLHEHPSLLKAGIRDKPTFILNGLLPWANMAVYLELPSWVKKFNDLPKERVTDDERTIAMKRFFNGDDNYRNKRFKVLPAIVNAPTLIKVIVPTTKEMTINGNEWRNADGEDAHFQKKRG